MRIDEQNIEFRQRAESLPTLDKFVKRRRHEEEVVGRAKELLIEEEEITNQKEVTLRNLAGIIQALKTN